MGQNVNENKAMTKVVIATRNAIVSQRYACNDARFLRVNRKSFSRTSRRRGIQRARELYDIFFLHEEYVMMPAVALTAVHTYTARNGQNVLLTVMYE